MQSGAYLLAPVLGTTLLLGGSLAAVLAADIAGAVVAAALLARVRIPDPPRAAVTPDVWRELALGWRTLVRHRTLLAISAPILVTCLIYVPLASLFPLMVREHFGGTAWHAALVEVLFAAGMMGASVLLGVWGGARDKLLMACLGNALLGVALATAGALPPSGYVAFAVACAVMGIAGNLFEVPYMAYVQSTVPPEALGRVISLLMSAMTLAIPAGLLVAGPLAEEVGIARWFFYSGIAIVVATALGWLLVRAARRKTATAE